MTTKDNAMNDTVLVLKRVSDRMEAYGDFLYPTEGEVTAPDWDPTPTCGGGLHGYLWGEGFCREEPEVPLHNWLVLEVAASDIVDLGGKVKFPSGNVVYCGDLDGAARYLQEKRPEETRGRAVIGSRSDKGIDQVACAGFRGTATAGRRGVAVTRGHGLSVTGAEGISLAGSHGNAQAGDRGLSYASHNGEASAGDQGTAVTRSYGSSVSGNYGVSISSNAGSSRTGVQGISLTANNGLAVAGRGGTAIAGNWGTAIAGAEGEAIAGIYGRAQAGERGVISICYLDYYTGQRRRVLGYIGEDGLLPNTLYVLSNSNTFFALDSEGE